MGRLSGKLAVITRADEEPGRTLAIALGGAGAQVLGVGAGSAAGIASGIGASELFSYQQMDLVSVAAWQRFIDRLIVDHGGLDILVNGPGPLQVVPLDETSVDTFDALFEANVSGPFVGIQQAMRGMEARGGGSIVNIGSRLGVRGQAGASAYCAAAGALTQLTLAAAVDGAGRKIRVNVIHAGESEADRAMLAGGAIPAPLGSLVAEDLAGAVLYLASDESRIVTGSEMTIDGGINAA